MCIFLFDYNWKQHKKKSRTLLQSLTLIEVRRIYNECIIKAWVTHASVGPSAVLGETDECALTQPSVFGGMTRESTLGLTTPLKK